MRGGGEHIEGHLGVRCRHPRVFEAGCLLADPFDFELGECLDRWDRSQEGLFKKGFVMASIWQ